MLNKDVELKLNSITDLPVVPAHLARILKALDDPDMRAKKLAELIETDQTLTSKILRSANSPYYGSAGQVSTIELAIVVMGLNTIKEIIVSMVVQKMFNQDLSYLFNLKLFWDYSIFCGAAARSIARRIGYKKSGEAFVAGLMHDMGYLVIVKYFTNQYREVLYLVESGKYNLYQAEKLVIGATHADIGSWLVKKWNLPDSLFYAIMYHHTDPSEVKEDLSQESVSLITIVSAAEWFAQTMAFKGWSDERVSPNFFCSGKDLMLVYEDILHSNNTTMPLLKNDISREYDRARDLNPSPLYKIK